MNNLDFTYTEISSQVRVEVLPTFQIDRSDEENDYYFFSYEVSITNLGEYQCQLLNRYWTIKDGTGQVHNVRGKGVVGQQPKMAPGEEFSYTSSCPLETPTGNMRGKFEMVDHKGDKFWVTVPVFFLRRPETFH
ncbi:MAG: Co2+/Mg2+ efflux protein ApaG [Halobacteriovoraceae bacterium]|jgi:ApaG protein|nr:Co2+/Mg2+ efflux protein ApaG [Halobacteriovoraceae bacterium]MBT5094657.1 Co2+/Mg2+ efflux protein ApaG [Halobacteriovoraceae bacterium]